MFWFFYNFCVKRFSPYEELNEIWPKMHIGLTDILVRFWWNLNLSCQIFEKYSKINFGENPYSGSRIVPCGQTNEQTDMDNLKVAFHSFAFVPKKWTINSSVVWQLSRISYAAGIGSDLRATPRFVRVRRTSWCHLQANWNSGDRETWGWIVLLCIMEFYINGES